MKIRAWDWARHEFFDSSLDGCQWFSVLNGGITAWALYEGRPYQCELQLSHPFIQFEGKPIFEGDTVTVVTYRRRDHLNKDSYTSNNDRLELSGMVVKDRESGAWKVYFESEIEEKVAVCHSTPPPKMPRKEWFVIEAKYRRYAALTQENLEGHTPALDLDALFDYRNAQVQP